jgi:hypothetical protein
MYFYHQILLSLGQQHQELVTFFYVGARRRGRWRSCHGGGGGAGGIVNATSQPISKDTSYPVVVGTGGVNDVQPNGGDPGGQLNRH